MKRENGSMLGSLDAKLNVIFLIADLRTRLKTMYLQILTLDPSLPGLNNCGTKCSFKVTFFLDFARD